ncbi:MAG: AsnC family transcriptional regulator [Candidatus Riflebacteria bacterium]|nr:AsnC family transcriptional regulator [Candidatus Riflebacteria bacterium]
MDEKDREIIRLLQKGLPLTPEPFKELGDKLWIDETSVISRLARMRQEGVIRHFGAFFDSKRLGRSGALAAMTLPEDKIEKVAAVINAFPGVTHNYVREGTPNIWFTLNAANDDERAKMAAEISAAADGARVDLFPTKRMFKVMVNLD